MTSASSSAIAATGAASSGSSAAAAGGANTEAAAAAVVASAWNEFQTTGGTSEAAVASPACSLTSSTVSTAGSLSPCAKHGAASESDCVYDPSFCIAPPEPLPADPLPSPHLPLPDTGSGSASTAPAGCVSSPPPPAAPPPRSTLPPASGCLGPEAAARAGGSSFSPPSSAQSTPVHKPCPVSPARPPPPLSEEPPVAATGRPPGRARVVFDPNVVSMETGGDVNVAHEGSLEELERGSGEFPLASMGNSLRYQMPRLSLLGKPLQMKSGLLRGNQDARYRRLQATVYNFLERPKSWQAITYHVFVFASVFVCLIFSVLSTIPSYSKGAGETLFYMELCMLFWFFSEYCLRLWSAGCRSRYQSWKGRAQFARRPFCIVDIIVIVASIVVLAMGSDRQMFAASALRGLRFFQILRMIRMDRRGGSWKLLASVVWAHRQELFTTIYIGFLGLIFSSFLIYLVEKGKNEKINTYADALWWGVNTFCTVGYGETIPESWLGKLIAGASCLAIISFYALPPGILGSGFALKVQQHQRQKHLIRRRVPAATLIQCLWRCYAADPNSTSIATWKPHMKPLRSPPAALGLLRTSSISRTFGRFSTIRRKTSDKSSITGSTSRRNAIQETDQFSGSNASEILSSQKNRSSFSYGGSPDTASPVSRSPVTEMGDSGGRRLRERFRAVAQSFRSHMSLPTCDASPKDGMALSLKDDDEDGEVVTLLKKHKDAIRAIRKIKFFVARKKFREALRPYDVKDVIEQYSAGHVDMLARIKGLQNRLDLILGRQGTKEVYESKTSLATRIVKVEHRVEDIESKIDWFIDQYKKDRILLLRDVRSPAIYSNSTSTATALPPPPLPPPPPPPPPGSVTDSHQTSAAPFEDAKAAAAAAAEAQDETSPLPAESSTSSSLNRLRSILVATAASSSVAGAAHADEPANPTPPAPPPRPFGIHRRNYSDLGPRLAGASAEAPSVPSRQTIGARRSTSQQHKKKRVTYRCASEQAEQSPASSPGLLFDAMPRAQSVSSTSMGLSFSYNVTSSASRPSEGEIREDQPPLPQQQQQVFTFPDADDSCAAAPSSVQSYGAEAAVSEQPPPPPSRQRGLRMMHSIEMEEAEVDVDDEEEETIAETVVDTTMHYRPESQPLLMATEVQKMKKSTC